LDLLRETHARLFQIFSCHPGLLLVYWAILDPDLAFQVLIRLMALIAANC
jgi:hypothetical protein